MAGSSFSQRCFETQPTAEGARNNVHRDERVVAKRRQVTRHGQRNLPNEQDRRRREASSAAVVMVNRDHGYMSHAATVERETIRQP